MMTTTNNHITDTNKSQEALLSLRLADETDTIKLGRVLAEVLPKPVVIYMYGELGAGKTTMVRGFLQSFGHQGAVKSPTYTLVEPYELPTGALYHFDLYRLADPEELEFIGIREYQDSAVAMIFEWPDKGEGMIPQADISVHLSYEKEGRRVELVFSNPSKAPQIIEKIRQKLAN